MTDHHDPDEPLSSEELLRRAREGLSLDEPDATSDRAAQAQETPEERAVVSSIEEASPEVGDVASAIDVTDSYEQFLKESSIEVTHDTAVPTPEASPRPVAPKPPAPETLTDTELESSWDTPRPTETSRTWDPNWSPGTAALADFGGQAPVGGPDGSVLPPTPPKQASALSRYGGWLIGLLIIGGFAVFSAIDNTTSVDRLEAGDCIEGSGDTDIITNVESVGCDQPHEVEVFSVITFSGPEAARGAAYPGEDAIYDDTFAQCVERFTGYVGSAFADSVYYVDAFIPVAEGWREGGRQALCVLFELDESNFELLSTKTSARDSRR